MLIATRYCSILRTRCWQVSEESDAFRAIADPTRRRMLDLLAARDSMTVSELSTEFPELVASGISKHLMTLRAAGLVVAQKQGRNQRYRIDPDGLGAALSSWAARYEAYWTTTLDKLRDVATEVPQHGAVPATEPADSAAVAQLQVNLFCRDVERCVTFYVRLGFPERFRTPAQGAPEHVEVEVAGVRIGLTSARVAREVAGLDITDGSSTEIALWCADVDRWYATAIRAGAEPLVEPADSVDGRLRYGWLRDPDGHQIKLIQQY